MRARAVVLGILSSTAVLAVGWQIGDQGQQSATTAASAPAAVPATSGTGTKSGTTATPTPTPSTASGSGSPSSTATGSGSAAATTAPAAPAATGASGTFTGTSTGTRYGNVQVQITVSNGTITDVAALQLTDQDSRSVSISNRAAPVLRQEVLAAQSANVQGVSGATYTSEAYLTSLQSALDQAGL